MLCVAVSTLNFFLVFFFCGDISVFSIYSARSISLVYSELPGEFKTQTAVNSKDQRPPKVLQSWEFLKLLRVVS